ncbi:hypothetical protein [Jiangella muralis]|uniref:hypothetical protein n=1 Tax=Jiangella muralis TaxID=702383 RepID=UPI00069DABE6|nr:hypothetical protein [Jiangella muralis]
MLYDCPECALPATVTSRGRLSGTSGPVEHVAVHCVAGHRFLGPADTLRIVLPIPAGGPH